MIKIYHNPRCKKSRAGLQHLQEKGVEFEIVEYMKDNLDEKALKDILIRLNVNPIEMVRTQEDIYKKQLKGQEFTDDEWVKIMLENPKLIKRPIVVKEYKAAWADPPENMDKLF
ncbi:MAG: arsenate reductase (glutaredoxin) [Bacteroidales bacterium]|nr:arsenate reductase (glutaredoxin) [Bacteroidales bacterium]